MISPSLDLPATSPQKRFSIATLGCKVNSFESELIAQNLLERRYRRVDQHEQADLCLINTCTVTAEADRQARQLVRRAVRNNPDAWVVVTGCYAQMDADACYAIPGVDLVVGNGSKLDIPELLEKLYGGELPPVLVGDVEQEISLPQRLISGFDDRARAFVQVQQGCDQGCTFCVIHQARGAHRSLPARAIRRQAQRLIMNGHRELVICGVDVGAYGSDLREGQGDLSDLLRQLTALEGDFRVRLSSIDPAHITDALIDLFAREPKLCPQLHLSLQSGSTLILKRMKRRATREILYERVAALRRAMPQVVLSADILVGFPTETREHFAQTLEAMEELEITYPHVFAYSPRFGTPAARIPDQVPVVERKRRAAVARKLGKLVGRKVAERRIGTRARVLIEGDGRGHLPEGFVRGRAADYFPVIFEAGRGQPGDWAEVEIHSLEGDELIARRLD